MGRRGPPPTPTKLRVLHGDRPQRINPREPEPEPGVPDQPPGLTPRAQEIWDYLVAVLEPSGVLTKADGLGLYMLAEQWAIYRDAATLVNTSAVLVRSDRGGLVRNPATTTMMQAAATVRVLCQEFGLTPAGRVNLMLPRGTQHLDRRAELLS
jgi:P27 family predicted phage terminase small subunit